MSRLYSLDASGNLLSSLPQVDIGVILYFSVSGFGKISTFFFDPPGSLPCLASLHARLHRPQGERAACEASDVPDQGDLIIYIFIYNVSYQGDHNRYEFI